MNKIGKNTGPFRYDLNQIPYDYAVGFKNKLKVLDLVDRVPKELQMEVHNIVHEVMAKAIPQKKKCKKAEWLSEEALQIAEERKDVKSKGEREMYNQLNAELQQEETRRPSSMNNAKK